MSGDMIGGPLNLAMILSGMRTANAGRSGDIAPFFQNELAALAMSLLQPRRLVRKGGRSPRQRHEACVLAGPTQRLQVLGGTKWHLMKLFGRWRRTWTRVERCLNARSVNRTQFSLQIRGALMAE